MYLERYILPVSNTLSRSFSVPLFSQFLSQIEIVAMGMRIHSVSRIISDLSLLILPDSSRFVVSRCVSQRILIHLVPISFLPIGTSERKREERKRNSREILEEKVGRCARKRNHLQSRVEPLSNSTKEFIKV